MKTLILLLGLLAPSFGATLIDHGCAGAGGANTGATLTLNTAGANFIVVWAGYLTAGSFADSGSNTWSALTAVGNNPIGQGFYVAAPVGTGAGHTFTYSGASTYVSICGAAFSGVLSVSPFDVQSTATNGSTSTLATGSVTPSLANSILVTGMTAGDGGSPLTVNSSFTVTDTITFVAGTHYAVGLAWKTASIATNPTWTNNVAQVMSGGIAVFKPSIGGSVRHRVVSQ